MHNPEPYEIFINILNSLNIKYCVTGSIASIIYGEPRLTHDIDIIVLLRPQDINNLEIGFPKKDFYIPPGEILELERRRQVRGHFNIIHHRTGFKADIYLCGTDEFMLWAITNNRSYEIGKITINLAPPEYVIIKKLEFFRESESSKHLTDIRSILANQDQLINKEMLDELIQERNLNKEFAAVLPQK
ncbi:MAG: hypothetical protein HUU54_09980 [Ignavibacteriaceae bacterium]|nr:hypothetical protein [Ignavibacteriaceae bacterium]